MQADTVVVGAGLAGSSIAHHLAMADLRVLLLEKSAFPRDKVYGDGPTPRAVIEPVRMDVDTSGWACNTGLRAVGGGHTIELPWPETAPLPNFGLACSHVEFNATLAAKAQEFGAVLRENAAVADPILHERNGRVIGAKAKPTEREPLTSKAPAVVNAGGVSARLAIATRREKAMNQPMGVAYQTYLRSGCFVDSVMESHLELWKGKPGKFDLMPGYGWTFPLAGGIINVGLGSPSSMVKTTGLSYRAMFKAWMANVPSEWGFTEENQVGRLRGAVLSMAFNRKPCCTDGLLLVGDAGGMVSPFNGEGIAYAPQAGRLTADAIVQAHSRPTTTAKDRALAAYPAAMREELGGYHSLGRVFARLIERPWIMHMCVAHGLPRPMFMRLVMRPLSDCYDCCGGDWMDRLISVLAKAAPKA